MKEQFDEPQVEIIEFEGEDVICASGCPDKTVGCPDETELGG